MELSAVHHSSPHLLRLLPLIRMRMHTDLLLSWVNQSCELQVHCWQSGRGYKVYIQRRNVCSSVVFIGQSRTMVEDVPDEVRVIALRNWHWYSNRHRRRRTRA